MAAWNLRIMAVNYVTHLIRREVIHSFTYSCLFVLQRATVPDNMHQRREQQTTW
jgi:hypothetical protein